MNRISRTSLVLALFPVLSVTAASCSQGSLEPEPVALAPAAVALAAPTPASPNAAVAAAPAPAPARTTATTAEDEDFTVPTESFSDPQKNFDEVRKALLGSYYDPSITEEALYRAAVAGMLERVDPSMRKWNKLLSPGDLAELHRDLSGELVGVGVKISFDAATGYIDVLGAIAGSPAEAAGLAAPDKIVTVDGKLYKGLTLRDVVADIRGKAGEAVTLSVLRGDKLVSVRVVRESVKYDVVTELVVDGDVGYVRIPSFNAKTPDALGSALSDLGIRKVRGVVLDLRGCPGGSFDDAVASVSELLPAGATVVRLKKRGATEVITGKRPPVLTDVPLAVLVDHNTSSGAELVAAALSDDAHAVLVGERTFGKWTVQTIDDLSNGYAIKYTHALFQSPSGKSFQGVGITPDVEVDMPDAAIDRAEAIADPVKRLEEDVQLKTAASLLQRGR
jgi:carboxyl-terminal processing protease